MVHPSRHHRRGRMRTHHMLMRCRMQTGCDAGMSRKCSLGITLLIAIQLSLFKFPAPTNSDLPAAWSNTGTPWSHKILHWHCRRSTVVHASDMNILRHKGLEELSKPARGDFATLVVSSSAVLVLTCCSHPSYLTALIDTSRDSWIGTRQPCDAISVRCN